MRLLYSALLILLLPLIVLRMLWRSRRAPAYRQRLSERLGFFPPPADSRPVIWIHAVSLGETLAARGLVERILEEMPGYQLAVTTTTPTGSAQLRRLFGERVFHVYAPWDTPGAVQRFLRRVRPRLLILMETELWPNMLHYCAAPGRERCPVLLANARLSSRSAAGYARLPSLTTQMLARLDCVAAQSADDAGRFVELGLEPRRVQVVGSVKFDIRLEDGQREQAAGLRRDWGLDPHTPGRPSFLVASTHEGEDAIALDALRRVREAHSGALLLLAPRHPERFAAVAQQCLDDGWTLARRSSGDGVDSNTDVLLIDTLGELALLFGVADVAVIGGSFAPRGGHNPLEAAVWGLPLLSGPSMFNFAEISERLNQAGALRQVADAKALGEALAALLADPVECERAGRAAQEVLRANGGALESLFAVLTDLLYADR